MAADITQFVNQVEISKMTCFNSGPLWCTTTSQWANVSHLCDYLRINIMNGDNYNGLGSLVSGTRMRFFG